jgi:excisionase family DNA binding protein
MLDVKYLTVTEVADKVRRSTATIISAINNGQLHATKTGGYRWLISESDFQEWFMAGAPTTAPRQDGQEANVREG